MEDDSYIPAALYEAAIAGDADAIAKLEMRADIILNSYRETILHIESRNGNTERVRFILREFANKNLLVKLGDQKETALAWAAYFGHTEVAEVLIDAARHLPPSSASDNTHDNPVTSFQAFLRHADQDSETALHAAVKEGHLDITKLLVEADPTDTHIQNNQGKTPMYIAVEKGYNDIVEIISTTCTAPSLDGPHGSTVVRIKNLDQGKTPGGPLYKTMDRYAFCVAAIGGDSDAIAKLEMQADILHVESQNTYAERVRFILREFAKKNILATLTSDEHPALHLAANNGHTEMAEILIDAATHLPSSDDDNPVTSFRAFLRQADEFLNTALHIAVMKGHLAIVKLLVEADPSDRHIQNYEGKTPMYIAVEEGLNDIVEIISTTCTAPSLDGPDGSTVVRIKNLDQAKSPGGTLYKIMDKDDLYAAAIAGDADAIAILEMQADKLNENEETILHVESENGNTERVRFILREFAHKNLLVKPSIYKHTALHLAVYFGHTEVAEVLIDAARHLPVTSFQAFLRQGDNDMDTALHAAVMEGNVDIVKLLVEADPSDTHIQNDEGKTPMYIAVEKELNDIVEIISTTCIAPSLDGPDGSTAARIKNLDQAKSPGGTLYKIMDKDDLYAAAIAGDADAIAILEMQADKLNENEETILHVESENGNTERVRFILREFAHKNLLVKPSIYKHTALHLAVYFGHTEVVEVLIDTARHLPPPSPANDNPITSFQAFLRHADQHSETALHKAVKKGYVDITKLLVEADPSHRHSQNELGETPMYIAAESGYFDMVKMICTTSPINLDGPGGRTTALHAAIKNLDKAKKKEDRNVIGIIINAVKNAGEKKVRYTDKSLSELFNKTDEDGCTVLELSVERNHVDVVELILKENPAYQLQIDRDLFGLMPLIYKAIDKEYKDIVKPLTECYERQIANANANSFSGDMGSFIFAIRRRNTESITVLLDNIYAKDLVTFADNLGWTALHHAAYHKFDLIIPAIVKTQKRFGHKFVYEDMVSTPFHVAAKKGHTSTMILLMQLWPPSFTSAFTALDKNGQNILHIAALPSKKEMMEGILKYCPKDQKKEFVNERDNNGNTPLHLLIQRGCLVPELFKYRGLDMWIQNKENWTAPDMLYFEDQIINDQAQIKIALDGIQIDQTRGIFSSSVLSSKRERKDVILNKQAKQMMDEKYARMKEDTAIANCFADAIAGDPISKAALEMKADTLNESGETILHVESMKGNTEHVRFIVMEFANKNLFVKLDRWKQTALHLAAHYGHTKVVEVLVGAARPNLPSSSANPVSSFQDFIRQANGPMQNTALHLAVLNGNVAIVKLLVEADPDDRHVQNNEGKTPIYIAAEKGYKEIVKEICTTCTALSLDGPGGSCKTTALHALIQNIEQVTEGASDVIRMMVDAAKRWSSTDDPSLVNFKALFSRTDESGSTVLQVAVERNYVDAVRLILQEDPAYQPGPEIKRNGLMRLIYKSFDNKYSDDIIESLSKAYKAEIDHDHEGVLALILAIKRRDEVSVLDHLKNAKKLTTFKEDNGWTPLHYAVYHEFDSILGAIIEAQHDAKHSFVYDDMVPTPFHVAVDHGHTSTVIRLMQSWPAPSSAVTAKNSPYTTVNKIGQNILHLAALGNNKEMVAAENKKEMIQGILKYCPEKYKDKILKQQDTNGDTPLHLLISHGCFIPELIKHKGLDTMVRNNRNWTPRDMLYFQSEIVGDQAQIKMALDDMQTGNFFLRSKKKNISESSVVIPSRQAIKDVMFIEHNNSLMDTQMKKGLGIYRKGINSQIVVSTLITTITFTVGFTIPGGLHQSGEVDEGMAVLSKKAAFKAFMVLDALALLLSTCSMFIYFLGTLYEDPYEVFSLHATTTVLNMASVVLMMLIFITGTYVVLSQSLALAITVCVIGSLFFLFVIFQLMKFVYVRRVKKIKD